MNRITALSALVALGGYAACAGGDSTDDTGTIDPCVANSVEDVFPADGVTNAYYRTVIDIELDDADDSATLTVSAGGSAVAGTTTADGNMLTFTPDSPLSSSTEHEVEITWADGACTVTTSFTTSDVGAAISDPSGLIGNAYDLDLESGRFVEPAGIGSLLGKFLGDVTLYLSVTDVGTSDITMVGALGDETDPTQQSACDPTIPFPTADFSDNPFFEVDATGSTTTISAAGLDIAIDDLRVSGAFAPDGSYISGGVLAGSIDTRPLVDLVEEGGAPEAICDLAASIGVECEDCGNGEVYCLSLFVDNLSAALATGTSISEINDVCTDVADAVNVCPDDCPAQ